MRFSFKAVSAALFLIAGTVLFAQETIRLPEGIPIDEYNKGTDSFYTDRNALSPYGKKELDDEKGAVIRIECDVSNASVYLNGIYYGHTNLTISDLRPGRYKLKVTKDHYEDTNCIVEVRKGYQLTYKIKLREIKGIIRFRKVSDGSIVTVDSTRVFSNTCEIISGIHTVRIRKFGYKDYEERVMVPPYGTITVEPEYKKVPFQVSSFSVSKLSINPDYSGGLGNTRITFRVTAPGSAQMVILNSYGLTVRSWNYSSFSQWDQSAEWNGTDDGGNPLPDGQYTVLLTANGSRFEKTVTLNRSLVYPLGTPAAGGFGFGKVACALPYSLSYNSVSVSGTAVLDRTDGPGFYAGCMQASFNSVVGSMFEYGITAGLYPAFNDSIPACIGANLKFSDTFEMGNGFDFSVAAIVRYGYQSSKVMPSGIDDGKGLGGGLLLGFSLPKIFAGFGAQYIWGAETGLVGQESNLITAGGAVSFNPAPHIAVFAYGNYGIVTGKEETDGKGNGLSVGAGVNMIPTKSSVLLSLSVGADIFPDSNTLLLSGNLGISFVF